MSRTPIRCPRCKTPLAMWHHHGRIKLVVTALADGSVPEDLSELRLVCKCGGRKTLVPAQDREQQAA